MGLLNSRSILNKSAKTLGFLSKSATTSPPKSRDQANAIQVTPEFKEIKRLIDIGTKLIFVTGGAGTGKSTLVNWIEKEYWGRVAIVAPTGIAALTVSGVTIHRMCKFPAAWIVDSDIKNDPKSVISKIKILIIDEISMVNANLLDAFDKFCKKQRDNKRPFGGLTVIMVGDLFQLPPVVDEQTKFLFSQEYRSAKFFAAHVLNNLIPSGIELSIPFRQEDEQLIRLLANIREGVNLDASIDEFNMSCKIINSPPKGAVNLAPRNRDVAIINSRELSKLPPPEITYSAKIEGKFLEKQLPAPDKVTVRVGAQVVLLNNSSKWVNGSVGVVTRIGEDKVFVQLVHSNKIVAVTKFCWTNYEYKYNEKEKKVVREVIGTFTQMPITLAWAMTIHKSQGLTLDKVHLDLGAGAFETGQTYVALSRSRSMSTITLAKKLSPKDIHIDREAVEFYRALRG